MSESSTEKDGTETAVVVRGAGGRFAKGGPGGPGRPKRGETLAEAWRRSTDWEAVRARLERIVTSSKSKDSDAVTAARELADRSWGKPLTSHELHVTGGPSADSTYDTSKLTTDEARDLLARLDALELKAGEGGETP